MGKRYHVIRFKFSTHSSTTAPVVCTAVCRSTVPYLCPIYPAKKLIRKKGTWAPIICSMHTSQARPCTETSPILRPRAVVAGNRQGQGGHRFACPNRRNWKRGARQVSRQEKREVIYPSAVGPEADVAGGGRFERRSRGASGARYGVWSTVHFVRPTPTPGRGWQGNLP
jgi:hypothetical protein